MNVQDIALLGAMNIATTLNRVGGDFTATAAEIAAAFGDERLVADYAFRLNEHQVAARLGRLAVADANRPAMVARTQHGGWALTRHATRWMLMLPDPSAEANHG